MNVYINTYIHTHKNNYTYTCTYIYKHEYKYIYKYTYVYIYRTKTFLEPSGCRTQQPGRTWLLGPEACSGTNPNDPFVSG